MMLDLLLVVVGAYGVGLVIKGVSFVTYKPCTHDKVDSYKLYDQTLEQSYYKNVCRKCGYTFIHTPLQNRVRSKNKVSSEKVLPRRSSKRV